ncbi:SpvB/TcaC N-terminal domain-containing protein [Chitinophaga sp. HK235]|uniref:SpvB/TcaC N-terminal domain-containing protein n=1 Tax=Chitinophaga sp. HK235 TaxID=2952571 RepID=UPI001BAB4338|nr:SpvB/TcaC N-terminal domain-containing protein [Chitinophaga sp. HK235]
MSGDNHSPVKPASFLSSMMDNTTETKSNAIDIPKISLPKGGGALKNIDEKFTVNPSNGTASLSIPLPFSPNRNGFTPQLSLIYNSGTGNSLFGIGWNLPLTAIQRSTDKKLPQYADTTDVNLIEQEDSFMLSGMEELVAVTDKDNAIVQSTHNGFIVREYRPRIESGFSRIERIYHPDKGYYWRVTSRENITTWFGYSPACRLADPAHPERIFSWLPELSYDNKGSWILYTYKAEDLNGVTNEVYERNRFNKQALFVNQHLSSVQYGNTTAYYPDPNQPYDVQLPQDMSCCFELLLDYGEYNTLTPQPGNVQPWPSRKDPYSSFRAGFETRTYRLCKRALMFHHFPDLNGGAPTLVRSLDFDYTPSATQVNETNLPVEVTFLSANQPQQLNR